MTSENPASSEVRRGHFAQRSPKSENRTLPNYGKIPQYPEIRVCKNQPTSSEADTMSIIQRDYLPERRPVEFPPELALLIVRKAAAMAAQFEERALDEMSRAAHRHLRTGQAAEQIAWQLGL